MKKKSKVASEIRLVPPIFSKSGKNTSESIAFKNSNVAKASKKSIHVKVTETLSNEAINDDTNSVHSDLAMVNDEVIQEGHAIRSAVYPTTSSSYITTRSRTVKYNYNIMTKVMQVFKGSLDDHFETWEENTRLYLEKQCPNISEDQKMTAVLLKIQGYPRMILRQHPNLKSMDDIFDALRPTYGADELTMINENKQFQNESVRVYFSRLKTNLHLLGYRDTTQSDRILLNNFVDGLQTNIRLAVKRLRPQRIFDAVSIAQEVESCELENEANSEMHQNACHMFGEEKVDEFNEKLEKLDQKWSSKFEALHARIEKSVQDLNNF